MRITPPAICEVMVVVTNARSPMPAIETLGYLVSVTKLKCTFTPDAAPGLESKRDRR